jgi:hypothetical protein
MSDPQPMDTPEQVTKVIARELASDDAEVRSEFMKRYGKQVEDFARHMGQAFINWRSLDAGVGKDDRRAYVSGLVYTAMTLHVTSMKVLLSGQVVAAGNIYRQVVETMALALLCSAGHRLHVLEAFIADKYSTNNAVRDLLRHGKSIGVNKNAEVLRDVQEFNHKYSHPSVFTIGHFMAFGEGGIYVSAAFDPKKTEFYDKEIGSRCSCAAVFSNFVDGVKMNVAKW